MSSASIHPVKMFIVSAPSGAGKSTLCDRALKEFAQLEDTITYTTRPMRSHESEGQPYHFVTDPKFIELRDQGFFVEWAVVHGKLYGTPRHQIEEAWQRGRWIIMDVDIQGAATFKRHYPGATSIFILPPSIDELRKRIMARDRGQTPDLDVRLDNAKKELAAASGFDYQVINQDIETAYLEFKSIIQKTIEEQTLKR